jgi:hypothetical protein
MNLVALPDDYDGDTICLGFALALTLLLLLQSPQCWKKTYRRYWLKHIIHLILSMGPNSIIDNRTAPTPSNIKIGQFIPLLISVCKKARSHRIYDQGFSKQCSHLLGDVQKGVIS